MQRNLKIKVRKLFMTKLKADDTITRTTAAKNANTTADATQPITHGS